MITVRAAEQLARRAHEGQVTNLGDARFAHVMRVADAVSVDGDELTVVAAVLHDAVEKGSLGWEDLVAAGASAELVTILDLLTERDGEAEEAYLARCASHPIALRVKQADLEDKLSVPSGSTVAPAVVDALQQRSAHRLAVLSRLSVEHRSPEEADVHAEGRGTFAPAAAEGVGNG